LNKPAQDNVRAAALDALDRDQRKHVAAYARIMSTGTGDEGDDLLQEAFRRWLDSDTPVEEPAQTCQFLRDAINSIRSNIFRHKKVVRRREGERAYKQEGEEDEPLDRAADPSASTEGPLFVQQVYDLCDDEEIELLLTAQADRSTPEQIQAELGWDDKKYETVRKRKRRLVIRLMREGKLL
jgi:DNA-directed RNA polymerase specialized sigma24 family protein